MSMIKLRNNPSRNGFDLSKRNLFSAKVGELLPVYCKEVIPGDKFEIDTKSFTRTMPLNTAAFTRIKEYYDWFFVPTNLLWNKFNSFVVQATDNVQHAASSTSSFQIGDTHPYMTLDNVTDYLNGMNELAQNGNGNYLNHFGLNRAQLSCKLLDYLGYGSYLNEDGSIRRTFLASNAALNPFPLLAYQKIYSDFYRDSQWEKAHAPNFNVDYLGGNNLEIDVQSLVGLTAVTPQYNMFDLRYANWNKDLFTGVLPNAQYGDAASVILGDSQTSLGTASEALDMVFKQRDTNASNAFHPIGSKANSKAGDYLYFESGVQAVLNLSVKSVERLRTAMGLDNASSLSSSLSVLALRQAEALQKWKEITQSQQMDYKNQLEAHFNVSVHDVYSERCKYIDGSSSTIDINEVVNTNLVNGDVQNIADIAGKGSGVQSSKTYFSSEVHGYLMCVYHAAPQLDYNLSTRISRQNLKTMVTDYAIPEFDATGMVSVPMIEMTNDSELNDSQLIGYAPRYYDYKTDVDEVHGSVRDKDSSWVASFDDNYLKNLLYRGNTNNGLLPIDYTFFKINPTILDSIFSAQITTLDQSAPNGVVLDATPDSDQLITNCYFDVKVVRNLDRNGLPY